jgi:transposase
MDDTHCQQFFQDPDDPMQRRYEALRAVFVEGFSQKQAADRYGFSHGALRNLIHDFRQAARNGSPPPFSFHSDEADSLHRTIMLTTKS